jgi:hypothetical protein
MKDSREATMLIQGILVWLMLAFGCATIWICSAAFVYFLQNSETTLPSRFGWAAAAATIIVGAVVGAAKLHRARRG